eukprot:CAMPEP_0180518878 /NCGR_PEP_ID=MMETSP1036_2-20121128/55359_1 /TAXON_ID=632150 /ORGANISM="Azadinium spinosum, Strain 3D9" /LENGTH=58 /DNA_ID=CAMNT_0022531119 /DNA_START=286 /DNA_END=459 /DNA_ORIENTATION=-
MASTFWPAMPNLKAGTLPLSNMRHPGCTTQGAATSPPLPSTRVMRTSLPGMSISSVQP